MIDSEVTKRETVNIRPGVNVLSVLRHLNYKPWYALAEFVDNAVQSALDNWERLQYVNGEDYALRVDIELDAGDGGSIVIRDNAAGIPVKDYQRAFRTADIPPTQNGLCEFGMGMKSASFWFSTNWSVRTKALGERRCGTIRFNLPAIMEGGLENLPVEMEPAKQYDHFTELVLVQPQKMPAGRTLAKIKDHLTGIYRQFLRDGTLELYFRGEKLTFTEPKVLFAPHPRNSKGNAVDWKKPVDLSLRGKRRVRGFVGIRAEGSLAEAGLALFRRRRLIVGSADEGYRPETIFGHSNDFRYQRIFGELNMEGFGVSHTKDGFQWDELEDEFLQKLKIELNKEPLPILRMALEYRVRPKTIDISRNAQTAVSAAALALQSAGPTISAQRKEAPVSQPPPETLPEPSETAGTKEIALRFQDANWNIKIEVVNDPAISNWLDISQQQRTAKARVIDIRLNFAHPFMEQFVRNSAEEIEPFIRIAAGLAIAEVVARDQGVKQAGTIRRHLNDLLRKSLSEVGAKSK